MGMETCCNRGSFYQVHREPEHLAILLSGSTQTPTLRNGEGI